jgi:DNA-binding response OmpR family regulator
LVGEDEDNLSLLRYVLRNNAYKAQCCYYHVTSVSTAQESLDALKKDQYDLLLCQCPVASLETLLAQVRIIDDNLKTIVIADKESQLSSVYADVIMFKPTAAELLERIRVSLYRKRGPSPGYKKKVAGIVSRQMAKEVAA